MTPDARRALADTIRRLRASLVDHIRGAIDGEWQLTLPADGLPAHARIARERFEDLVHERARVHRRREQPTEAARSDLEKLAAATWCNRLVFLRILEANALKRAGSHVITGYKKSPGYIEFLSYAGPLAQNATFGYDVLLRVLFDELAVDLPGLFAPGVADLVPFPPAALNELVEAVNDSALDTCWTDDTTPGWVYQFWNDPDREALDAKLNDGKKLAPHEIASKTQMFTERYMVEWLLHNSLGPAWLRICRRNGWTADAVRDGTLDELERRRVEWRGQRERGEVALDELMPLETDADRRWAYYVPQELPEGDEGVPASIRELRLLDPACGSGHFLVIAFELLVALYEEEARHRGVTWSRREIAESILESNLHGIDLDVRAVQIAAAALWVKARQLDARVAPKRMNLVAADLGLQRLGADDPARRRFVEQLKLDSGMPAALVEAVWKALADVDTWGSLLRVEKTLHDALLNADPDFFRPDQRSTQGSLLKPEGERYGKVRIAFDEALTRVLERVEKFLAAHTGSDDLGLRLEGEQLATGLRFLGLVREGTYHLVVGNPPYQGTSKMADAAYVARHYPRGKADLYAAFLERGLELCVAGGTSALLTMRNWMFIAQYKELREWLLTKDLRGLGDFAVGAFDDVPNDVLSVVVSVLRNAPATDRPAYAVQPSNPSVPEYDRERTRRKRAAVLVQVGRHVFRASAFAVIGGSPMPYWWNEHDFDCFQGARLLKDVAPAEAGIVTGDDNRFTLMPHEVAIRDVSGPWQHFVRGAKGEAWFEPSRGVLRWHRNGLELHAFRDVSVSPRFGNEQHYGRIGIAFTMIGNGFVARRHRFPGMYGKKGSSVVPEPSLLASILCMLNTSRTRRLLEGLNPGLGFEVGDVNRLPVSDVDHADVVVALLDAAFTVHESHREPSVEFRTPGPSPWGHAQDWAQSAVDRPEGAPLPPYAEVLDPEPPTDHVSYALGVALGRFHPGGEGVLDPANADLSHALPHGVLFLDGATDGRDDLEAPATAPLRDAWRVHGPSIDGTSDVRGLRAWLRTSFFAVHKKMYDNRPIHWPLSSANRTFVAWVNIHRMGPNTLIAVLARAETALRDLKARASSLRSDRDGADAKASKAAEKALGPISKQLTEIEGFVANLRTLATKGPPPPSPSVPPREVDAPYDPDLDDGVMINSAALWPVLEPQWKDPKKWWTELATASGRKDYDWSHLAMRYWPTRVDDKCRRDPSLGVAHGCFWRYHPERAYAWELRLQDEIGPDFLIDEIGADARRAAFLEEQPEKAREVRAKERKRRKRKYGADAQFSLFGERPGEDVLTDDDAEVTEAEVGADAVDAEEPA